jgi:tRNA A-37 threonylcarbamoyl transferase component Bud32
MLMETTVDSDQGDTFRKEGATPAERDQLRREASVLAAAAHPGIVRLIGTAGGDPPTSLVLRRVRGQTFGETAIESLEVLAGIGAALATTVADLHDLGFVHRSISPSHILVDDEGRPVLCGFGSAGCAESPSQLFELRREDVRALAQVLLGRLSSSANGRVRAVLALAAGTRIRSRRCDARWLARQLVRRVPTSRLSPPCSPADPSHPVDPELQPLPSRPRSRILWRSRWGPKIGIAAIVGAVIGVAALVGAPLVTGRAGRASGDARGQSSVPCPAVDQGCGPVARPGGVITTSAGRFRLSTPAGSAFVVVGRWDCSPEGLPAEMDVATGDVWVFRSWPGPGRSETARLLTRVQAASGLQVLPTRAGCDLLRIQRSDRPGIIINPRPA